MSRRAARARPRAGTNGPGHRALSAMVYWYTLARASRRASKPGRASATARTRTSSGSRTLSARTRTAGASRVDHVALATWPGWRGRRHRSGRPPTSAGWTLVDFGQGVFDYSLDGAGAGLALPAREGRALVGERQGQRAPRGRVAHGAVWWLPGASRASRAPRPARTADRRPAGRSARSWAGAPGRAHRGPGCRRCGPLSRTRPPPWRRPPARPPSSRAWIRQWSRRPRRRARGRPDR